MKEPRPIILRELPGSCEPTLAKEISAQWQLGQQWQCRLRGTDEWSDLPKTEVPMWLAHIEYRRHPECCHGVAASSQPAEMTDDEKLLRRMLCVAYAGALAYMDDGEASDSRMHPTIDFMRDSPKDIPRKILDRNRVHRSPYCVSSKRKISGMARVTRTSK